MHSVTLFRILVSEISISRLTTDIVATRVSYSVISHCTFSPSPAPPHTRTLNPFLFNVTHWYTLRLVTRPIVPSLAPGTDDTADYSCVAGTLEWFLRDMLKDFDCVSGWDTRVVPA
jgi:hypothetical protein